LVLSHPALWLEAPLEHRPFLFLAPASWASVANIYLGQSAAGGDTGANCANQHAYTFFNSAGNWGAGAAQIGSDTVVHLCGTINGPNTNNSTVLTFQGSGTSGHSITLFFEAGAKISVPSCNSGIGGNSSGCININGKQFIVIDGNNQSPTIQATANGTSLSTQLDSVGIYDGSGLNNIEIKNCTITGMYVHTGTSDNTHGDGESVQMFGMSGSSIHDCTFDQQYIGIDDVYQNGDNNLQIYNNTFDHYNWGVHIGNNNTNTLT
jgi:hypothetical protein